MVVFWMTKFIELHANAKNLSGRTFGRLTAVGPIRKVKDKSGRSLIVWQCRCSCGNVIETRSCNLISGDTASCGCLHIDTVVARSTKHGHAKRSGESPEFSAWARMVSRCEQPSMRNYAYYGGRGIKVCDRWRHSFSAFLEDMGPKPTRRHSIDRIDFDGDYEPSNCRWATHLEQMANTRRNRMLTAFGETLHMQEWCRRMGIKQQLLWDRLSTGWPIEKALTTPTGAIKGGTVDRFLVTHNGREQTLREWARDLGVTRKLLHTRLKRGWSVERAFTQK